MEDVWREDDTTPGAVEAALRNMFAARHKEERAYVPARVMNMVVIVDKEFRGEIENRLTRVGSYHPSRLVICAVEPGRRKLAATRPDRHRRRPAAGAISVGRERVELLVGERHLLEARHDRRPARGHRPRDDGLVAAPAHRGRRLAAAAGADRADRLPGRARRRVRAAARRRPLERHLRRRSRLAALDAVARADRRRVRLAAPAAGPDEDLAPCTVRHREDSLASGLLFCGWLASRLGWEPGALSQARGRWSGHAHTRRQDIKLTLRAGRHELAGPRGRDDRARFGQPRSRSTARPAGCARCGATATGPSARGRSWAPRAARAESSARASAKRCCAIPPIVPR